MDLPHLLTDIRAWAAELGFAAIGVSDLDLAAYRGHLERWLADGFHGEMEYMARHAALRLDPQALEPYAARVLVARMDCLPADTEPIRILGRTDLGYIARYALGRDYHRVLRPRLARLAARIRDAAGGRYRAFVDSAPVLEKALAAKAGLGWIGKHTLLLDRDAGSFFLLGEILTDLPLPVESLSGVDHCGRCSACMSVCPTQAIVAPHRLDARRCISYLTIEHRGTIPHEFRQVIGNRIFGCDDCQLVCPWNRFAKKAALPDFEPRHGLDQPALLALFAWNEAEFLRYTEGTALRRLSYPQWLRNVAVALGNAPASPETVAALKARRPDVEPWLAEHIDWALGEQERKRLEPAAIDQDGSSLKK
jgi:epoxyqueuosine reductase